MRTKIVIYGYSGAAKDVIYSLDEEEFEIVGMVDDAIEAQGRNKWVNIEVKAPECLKDWIFDYIIISTPWHYESMMEHLKAIGIKEEKIIVWKPVEKIARLDQRIAYLRLCIDQIRERDIKGACAEVGVYKGEFAKYINRYLPDRKLYLFDTFEGFGNQNILEVERTQSRKGTLNDFCDASISVVLEKMKNPNKCIICKGYFPQTAEGVEDEFALVSLDADLYEPILRGLEYFYPRLVKGGYIFIHDFGGYDWPGVSMAVNEYCQKHEISILPIFDRCLSAIISK